MNIMQRTLLDTYSNGDHAGVHIPEEVDEFGDSLLSFLIVELSEEEDCSTVDEGINRLINVIDDVQSVIDELEKI